MVFEWIFATWIATAAIDMRDRICITRQVLIEAEGEPYQGQVEVAGVIKERARRSGQSACEVIASPRQFGSRRLKASGKSIRIAWKAAGDVPQCHATHFDHYSSRQSWFRSFPVSCRIGNHVFLLETT